ncbi:recombinase family protein [Ruminococcaceae bacterium OttesenSCG-928-D13]|nr:recombinase family protein [Ruminococcaceae bacterium OttesenSCG-928-D13]
MNRRYDVGIYTRLSVEDTANSAKGKRKGNPFQRDSTSIENQKVMLREYALLRGWNVVDTYTDDGFSGGNFHRPGFERMVADAEAGRIDLILVKDLSRLGRDYIEVGRYTDEVFPRLGCRFIALMDDIDSEGNDDLLPFRSLLNDYHLRDLSRKIRSVLHAKAHAGEYIGSYAPYGYIKNPDHPARLAVDPYAADIVRRIFTLRAQKTGYAKIAAALNNDGILPPRAYWFQREGRENPYRHVTVWTDRTVKLMLHNEVYLGHTVKLITGTRSYKDKTTVHRPEEAWARADNTHEAIVSQEMWNAVQRISLSRCNPADVKKPERSLFAGLLVCSNGHSMVCTSTVQRRKTDGRVVRYPRYYCSLHSRTGGAECSWHTISEKVLLKLVQADVQSQLAMAEIDEEGVVDRLRSRHSLPALLDTKKELEQLSDRMHELDGLGMSLYEDRLAGKISPETFQSLTAAADTERAEKQAKHRQLSKALAAAEQVAHDVDEWIQRLRAYLALDQPDRNTLHELIESIEIGERVGDFSNRVQDVRITYRFVGQMGGELDGRTESGDLLPSKS